MNGHKIVLNFLRILIEWWTYHLPSWVCPVIRKASSISLNNPLATARPAQPKTNRFLFSRPQLSIWILRNGGAFPVGYLSISACAITLQVRLESWGYWWISMNALALSPWWRVPVTCVFSALAGSQDWKINDTIYPYVHRWHRFFSWVTSTTSPYKMIDDLGILRL